MVVSSCELAAVRSCTRRHSFSYASGYSPSRFLPVTPLLAIARKAALLLRRNEPEAPQQGNEKYLRITISQRGRMSEPLGLPALRNLLGEVLFQLFLESTAYPIHSSYALNRNYQRAHACSQQEDPNCD
jgi:hypothetical protein